MLQNQDYIHTSNLLGVILGRLEVLILKKKKIKGYILTKINVLKISFMRNPFFFFVDQSTDTN